MIDRSSTIYQEAKWRVKIGHAFLEKGYDIKGVIHVGSNDGYEVSYYLQLGIEKVICFEPHPIAIKLFKEKYAKEMSDGKVKLFEFGLGNENKAAVLRSGADTGQSSTFLRVNPKFAGNSPFRDTEAKDLGRYTCQIKTFMDFVGDVDIWKSDPYMRLEDYDCLVLDVEGMELEVLKGMGRYITMFDFINVECSEEAIFEGQPNAQEVVDFLETKDFRQDSPIERHDDIFFIKKGL